MQPTREIAETSGQRVVRHDAPADFIGHQEKPCPPPAAASFSGAKGRARPWVKAPSSPALAKEIE